MLRPAQAIAPPLRLLIAVLCAAVLAGCSTDDDEADPTPTQVPPTPTLTAVAVTVAPTVIVGDGEIASDGICQVILPEGWVDDTTGRGSAPSGARFELFGGRIRSDEAWTEAVDLVKQGAASRQGAEITETENSIRVDFADGRGFDYRARYGDIYCDFTVTSPRTIPEDEQAQWESIIASLSPVSS